MHGFQRQGTGEPGGQCRPAEPQQGARCDVFADRGGAGGWVHYTLLSGVRTVLVEKDMTPLRMRPTEEAQVNAYAEAGVIARLGECVPGWCRLMADGQRGWAETAALWGVAPDELRE